MRRNIQCLTGGKKVEKQLKYVVLGAGGTGGPIGGYLTRAGKDVTLIARGRHLEAMKSDGLEIELGEEHFLGIGESLFHGRI